jgi:hypothetical protein
VAAGVSDDGEEELVIICRCGGAYTVRLGPDTFGCVRCGTEVTLPPLWLDLEGDDPPVTRRREEP